MTFDAFLQAAWNEHGERPQEIADRLSVSLHVVETPDQLVRFAALVTHVYGEHLGQWERGAGLLDLLRGLPAFDGSGAVIGSLARGIGALRYAGGDRDALKPLTSDDRVSALATAASALAGRGEFAAAVSAYNEAIALASKGLPADSPAVRALAIGGNNLAAALEEKKDRDPHETQGMLAAAEGGLKYWTLAGTWLEVERAEYRLTRSLLQAGEPHRALQSARRCIEICDRNGAPAFERFFGYAVLALAQRSAGDIAAFGASREYALRMFEQVAEDERVWCEPELRELGA